jgi:hypothetical protein
MIWNVASFASSNPVFFLGRLCEQYAGCVPNRMKSGGCGGRHVSIVPYDSAEVFLAKLYLKNQSTDGNKH